MNSTIHIDFKLRIYTERRNFFFGKIVFLILLLVSEFFFNIKNSEKKKNLIHNGFHPAKESIHFKTMV